MVMSKTRNKYKGTLSVTLYDESNKKTPSPWHTNIRDDQINVFIIKDLDLVGLRRDFCVVTCVLQL